MVNRNSGISDASNKRQNPTANSTLPGFHNNIFLNFPRAPFNYFHPFCFPHNSSVMQSPVP